MGIIHTAKKYIFDELYNKIITDREFRNQRLNQNERVQVWFVNIFLLFQLLDLPYFTDKGASSTGC